MYVYDVHGEFSYNITVNVHVCIVCKALLFTQYDNCQFVFDIQP